MNRDLVHPLLFVILCDAAVGCAVGAGVWQALGTAKAPPIAKVIAAAVIGYATADKVVHPWMMRSPPVGA